MQTKLKMKWQLLKRTCKRSIRNLTNTRAKRPGTPEFHSTGRTEAPYRPRVIRQKNKSHRVPVASMILAGVIILSVLPTPTATNFTAWAKKVLSTDVELKKEFGLWDTFGEIRRVSGDLIAPVLSGWITGEKEPSPLDDFAFPASGSVVPDFEIQGGGTLTGGILIESDDARVLSTAGGTVKSIVKSEIFGEKVTILHDGGYLSTYDLLNGIEINVGDRVEALQPLGTCDRFFYFCLSQNGQPLDVSAFSDSRSV